MIDFYPMVLAALSKLDRNTEEARQALYQRARTALAGRLRSLDPPLSEQRIMEERLAFEEAVRRAEADWAQGLVEHELLSKLADAIEHDVLLADLPQRTGQTWMHLSGTLEQFRSGAQFEYTQDGAFAFAAMGTQADCATAADPLVRSIRSELEHKARELAGRTSQISDPARRHGLTDAVRMFAQRIGSEAQVAADIGTLWALHVALGAYADGSPGAPTRGLRRIPYDKLPKPQQIAMLDREILMLSRNCMPHGVPGMFLGGGHGIQLVQGSGMLAQLTELNHDFRLIPTDGRPHTKDPDPAFSGEGVGHWEGDTLLIDTVAIDERVWNTDEWTFHSDQEHVIERITRPSLNYLNYQVTIEDPKVLSKPWNSVIHHFSLSHESLLEWYCGINSHDDEELQALKQRRQRLLEEPK